MNEIVITGRVLSDELNDLVIAYAPRVVFHEKEKYFPCSLEWIFSKYELYLSDDQIVCDKSLLYGDALDVSLTDIERQGFDHILIGEGVDENRCSRSKMYVHIYNDPEERFINLEYNFLFPYSGVRVGSYDGLFILSDNVSGSSWEEFTVRFTPDLKDVIAYGFSHQGDKTWYKPDSLDFGDKTNQDVYCALHSHATYAEEKSYEIDGAKFEFSQLEEEITSLIPELTANNILAPVLTASGAMFSLDVENHLA